MDTNTKSQIKVNENVKDEMNKIVWTEQNQAAETAKTAKTETAKTVKAENKKAESKKDESKSVKAEAENQIIIESDNKEVKEEAAKETETKKRNIIKFGDKEWASKIPQKERFTEKTVVCFRPGDIDKIGRFSSYGKKEGIIWVDMYKKGSLDTMSKQWAIQIAECEIVENANSKGKLELNPKYAKDSAGIYYTKKDYESKVAKDEAKKKKAEEAKKNASTNKKDEKTTATNTKDEAAITTAVAQ